MTDEEQLELFYLGEPLPQRPRKTVCAHGHPLDQVYHQRDYLGILRTYRRCSRCRRVNERRARDRVTGQRSLLSQA